MEDRDVSGVEMVLAGLTGDGGGNEKDATRRDDAGVENSRSKPRKENPAAAPKPRTAASKQELLSQRAESDRPKTRIGRPPGRKTGEAPPKRKTSILINAELMDAYADRSWKERCQMGELVERALSYYREQNWGNGS